jgi:hypothetical protein
MRRRLRNLRQTFGKLTFDAGEFLQFGDVHVLEALDLHGDGPLACFAGDEKLSASLRTIGLMPFDLNGAAIRKFPIGKAGFSNCLGEGQAICDLMGRGDRPMGALPGSMTV